MKCAFKIACDHKPRLTRHERYKILMKAGDSIAARLQAIARLITLESGLCIQDMRCEVGRASCSPTLIDRVRGEMELLKHEIFGPVSPVIAQAARPSPT